MPLLLSKLVALVSATLLATTATRNECGTPSPTGGIFLLVQAGSSPTRTDRTDTWQLIIQDGFASGGPVDFPVRPLEGESFRRVDHTTWPAGMYTGDLSLNWMVSIGDYLWLIPKYGLHVVKLHKATGAVIGYNTWPAAWTKTTSNIVGSAAYDLTTGCIWMAKYDGTRVITIDTNTGTMAAYNAWPSGFNSGLLYGAVAHGDFVWMSPRTANMALRIRASDGSMTGFSAWPAGYSAGTHKHVGAVFDGARYVWLIARDANMHLKVDTAGLPSDVMLGFNQWPTGYSKGSVQANGGIFDGGHVYPIPVYANMVVQIHKDTGVMVGFNNWPVGFVAPAQKFWSGVWCSQYVWLAAKDANMHVRLDPTTGVMWGFETGNTVRIECVIVDFSDSVGGPALYMMDRVNTLRKFTFWTETPSLSPSAEFTQTAPFLLQDGVTFQGPSPVGARPLSGTKIRVTEYPTMPGGFVGGASPFTSIVHAGDYIWFVPYTAMSFVRFHKATGAVTGYSVWPSGSAKTSSNTLAYGSVYDHATGFIWNCVGSVYELISFDTASGAMVKHVGWPTGFVPTGTPFRGGCVHKGYLWLSPYSQHMVVRVATVDGTMADMGNHGASFSGFVYDGAQFGWLVRHSGATTVKYDLETGADTAYSGWPGGGFSAGSVAFHAGAFDGQKVWMIPRQSNMFVSIDKDTATMAGYGTWPVGWAVSGGTAKFVSGGFDGLYVWAFPKYGNMIVRVDSTTGVMRGLSREGTTAPWGATFDLATQSIYLLDNPSNILFRLQFSTDTETATETHEATQTARGVILQDGGGYSGPSEFPLNLLGGTHMRVDETYSNMPAGFTPGSYATCGIINPGGGHDYLWLLPYCANMIVRIHKTTGVMTEFSSWPGGFTPCQDCLRGGAYDRRTGVIWMSPAKTGPGVVTLDTATGAMALHSTGWPAGLTYSSGSHAFAWFTGGFVRGSWFWMNPRSANMVVRVNTVTHTMQGFNNYPSSYSSGTHPWSCTAYDGSRYGWMIRQTSNRIQRIDLDTGDFQAYTAWPGGFSPGTHAFHGATMDAPVARHLWMTPREANMIVRLHRDTGTMTGYNTWPTHFTLGSTGFYGCAFDGQYLWGTPGYSGTTTHVIRLDTFTGAMTAFDTPGGTGKFSAVMDPESGTLFMTDIGGITHRVSTHTLTQTATETKSETRDLTVSLAPTDTKEPTPTGTASSTVTPGATNSGQQTWSAESTLSHMDTLTASRGTRSTSTTTTVSLEESSAIRVVLVDTSHSTSAVLVTLELPVGLNVSEPRSLLVVAEAPTLANATTCGPKYMVFTNGTWAGDNFTLPVVLPSPLPQPTTVAQNVTLSLPLWLLRDSSVTVSMLNPADPVSQVFTLKVPIPLNLTNAAQGTTIASVTPPLHRVRHTASVTTHLSLTGTSLDLLPRQLLLGPTLINVSVHSATSATLGPIPVHPLTIADVLTQIAVTGENVQTMHQLFGGTSGGGAAGGNCPWQDLVDQLNTTALPPTTTPVDFVDFDLKPNGSVTVLPKIVAATSFPTGAFVRGGSIPTIEAGGPVVSPVVAGVQFQNLAGATVAANPGGAVVNTALASTAFLATPAVANWARSSNTHHRFTLSQPDAAMEPFVNLTLTHQWSSRFAQVDLSIPIIRPQLAVHCVTTNMSTSSARRQGVVSRGVKVEVSSANGSPRNVSLSLLVESSLASITLTPLASDLTTVAACASSYPGQHCMVRQLTLGVSTTLNFVVSAPSYYQSDLTVVWDADAAAAFAPISGRFVLVSTSGSQSSSGSAQGQVTASPVSPGANTQNSAVFGFSASAPCVDALLLSWLIFTLVLLGLVLVAFYLSRSVFKATTQARGVDGGELHCGAHVSEETLKLEALRSHWLKASMFRSLLLHHQWISALVPCHDQCALGHGLATFNHLLTLLWLCALLVIAMAGSGDLALPATTKVVIALLTVFLAQPLRPLLGAYYNAYVVKEDEDEGPAFSNSDKEVASEMKKVANKKEGVVLQSHDNSALRSKKQTHVSLFGLDDVELGSEEGEEKEENASNNKEGEEVEGEGGLMEVTDFEDDVVNITKEQGDEGGNNTLQGLSAMEDTAAKREEEEECTEEESDDVEKMNNTDVAGISIDARHSNGPLVVGQTYVAHVVSYIATPARNKGHLINVVYMAMATLLAFSLGFRLTPESNSTICAAYLSEILPIVILVDILAVQPLVMLIVYGYRWTISNPTQTEAWGDEDDGMRAMLHPRDCKVLEHFRHERKKEDPM